MAENNPELDAINHLLKIEKQASGLINDATSEADKRRAAARAKYNEQFKTAYDKVAQELEKKYQSEYSKIKSKYKSEIETYKKTLESKNQEQQKFFALLDKLLFS